jgi:DNA polymerase-4
MHLCVEKVQDREIVSQLGGNAPEDPSEANMGKEGAANEPPEPERAEISGGLARWFGFSRSPAKLPNIVHVNLDGFFASVEQVLNPKLRAKPVLVGTGLVFSASLEAKLCGVKTAMTFPDALRICPNAIIVPAEYDAYADFAERVRSILESYTPAVEAGSQDDFYLNFAGMERRHHGFQAALRRMQSEILGRTGLRASIGAGRSKVVAATASRLPVPSGLRVVAPGEEESFLAPIPVEKLHSIGPVYGAILVEHGIATVGELLLVPRPALQAVFGESIGKQIWKSARGQDVDDLLHSPAGSISREIIIEGGFNTEFFREIIRYLGKRVSSALRENGQQGRAVGLRVRYVDDFSAYESMRISATNDEGEIFAAAKLLFAKVCTRGMPLSRIGLTANCCDPCEPARKLDSKDLMGRAARGRRVDSINGDYAWNLSRAFG